MGTYKLGATLALGLALICITSTMAAGASTGGRRNWLATGTVTRVDGFTLYLLGRDSRVYTIDSARAQLVSSVTAEPRSIREGDKIRVFGTIDRNRQVTATRIRLLEPSVSAARADVPNREIKIIYERPQPETPNGAGPTPECQIPAPEQPCSWDSRGLITEINYDARQIKLRTSSGQFTVNIIGALLVQGARRVGLGRFSLGDAVRVSGSLVCDYEVNATRVSLLRTKIEAENVLPQMPVALGGVIQQVDYPSMTFTMWTETTPITVMADQDTVIQHQQLKRSFTDLRPGMRIKMNGNGSLGTGYAAREILIIGVAP